MDFPADTALFSEDQVQPDAGQLFEKDTNLSLPPKNADELAAQLALAKDDDPRPYEERVKAHFKDMLAYGANPILQDVAKQEREDHIAGAQAVAEGAAQAGNTVGLENAARMIQQAQARLADEASHTEGMKATAQRSLEAVSFQYAAPRYKSIEAFDQAVTQGADELTLRNLVASAQSELEGETSLWDKAAHFAGQLLPFSPYDILAQRTLNKATGNTGINPFNAFTSVQELRTFVLGLHPEERVELVKGLMKEEIGLFGDNKAANIELLRKLSDMTLGDAGVDTVFNALSTLDAAQIGNLLFKVVRRGIPAKVVNDVAGAEAAARAVVRDLTTGSKVSGLNDAEQVARLLAIGKNPLDLDPAAFSGMSAAGQNTLRQMYDQLLESARNRLISSGLTQDEVKEGLAAIRARYSHETNQAIHSVIFGEGSETGQRMTVYWQGPDGKAFSTKEAAEAWAKAEGKVDYEVVPRNLADKPEFKSEDLDFTPKSGGPSVDELEAESLRLKQNNPNVLLDINGNVAKSDSFFGQMAEMSDGDPMSLQLIDLYRTAALSKKSAVPAKSVLETIASQSSDEDMRFLARHLLSTEKKGIDWNKVPVQLHYELRGSLGTYNVGDDTVKVGLQSATDPNTLLHEIIHAHNSQIITLVAGKPKLAAQFLSKEQIAAANTIIDLHKRIKVWFNTKVLKEAEKYGSLIEDLGDIANNKKLQFALDHPVEIITHGLTSPRVRDVFKKLKLRELGYTENTTVFSKLWDAFKGLLGLKADDTVLARLVETQERFAQSITPGARQGITLLRKAGKLDAPAINQIIKSGGLMQFASRKGPLAIAKAIDKEIAKEEKKLLKVGDTERDAVVARIQELRREAELLKPKPPAAPTGEWLVKEQRLDPIAAANVGKFSEDDIRSMPWLAVDPKHGASELAIEERVIGVHAEAKTRHDLVKFLTPFYTKLSKAGKVRVKAVLEQGDSFSNAGGKVGKEFSYSELRGMGLSEEEAQAYFAARQIRMVSYHLRNDEMVRALKAEGYKEVEFLGTGEKYAGKVLEESEAGQTLGKAVFDTTSGKPYLVDSETLAASYKTGKRVVTLKQPVNLGGKMWFNVLVDDTTAKARDIVTALHYRPGEFSRIYSDQYFITIKKMAEVDGKPQEVLETVRTAASSREAKEYVDAHRQAFKLVLNPSVPGNIDEQLDKLIGRYTDPREFKAAVERGDYNGYVDMDFHYTRNKEEYLNSSVSEAMTNGRLFTSKRSDKLLSVDRDRRNTLDVFESLQAEMTNISRIANISMWRDNMIRRWMNTFGHMLPNRTGNDVADFFAATGATFTRGSNEALFAERTHRYIIRQLGVKNSEERFYENVTRMLTEKLFTGNERIESVGAFVRQKGWLGFVRNWNFNLNLGMFNPAQLIVQANGAATAMILSPLHGVKAAYTFPLLRMALASDNPQVWSRLARMEKLKNLGLSSEREFADIVKAVRKTGILDNMKSTSLWNLEDGALNIFGGYPSRAASHHTFFFNRGEEFNRLVSFDVARREWMAAHPGLDWTTDAALKQMVVRMDDLTQNMTKANLAFWQKGVLSIPFQFAQYNIKLAANVMTSAVKPGRGFSRMEAAQLLLGHVILYGAAGNGLMWVLDEVLPNEVKEKMPVAAKELLAQGLITWVFDSAHEALTGEGAKVAIGNRLGSFDYWQRIGDAIFKDPGNVYEALLGPTVSTAKRLGVILDVAKLWHKDPDLTGQEVLEGLAKMGTEQVATLRNTTKAYLYAQHQGKMLDRQGVALGELNKNELLWQALGFQPTVSFDINNLIKSKHDHAQAIDDIAKQVMRVQSEMIQAMKDGNDEKAAEKRKLLNALFPENAGDFMEVQQRIRNRLYPFDTEMQKLLGEYVWKGRTYNQPVVVTEQPKGQ